MTKAIAALTLALAATSGMTEATPNPIIGGTAVATDNYKWLGSLQTTSGNHFCGSSLIAPNIVITAAHCVSSGATNFRVRLGTTDLNSNRGEVRTPRRVFVHENYSSSTIRNDIAIIELTEASSVTPVSLDLTSSNDDLSTGTYTIAGWGLTRGGASSTPRQMREVDIPLVPDTTCDNRSPFNTGLHGPSMVCIGLADGSKTACNGDSGGPLFKGNTQIGLTSWGARGCTTYAVYTQLPFFKSWIDGKVAQIGGTTPTSEPTGGPSDSCKCIGSGTDVGATCGNWLNAGFNWCYSDVQCPGSTRSQRYPSLWWFRCTPSRLDFMIHLEDSAINFPEATIPGSEDFFLQQQGPDAAPQGGENFGMLAGVGIGAAVAGIASGAVFMVYKKQRDAAVDSAIDRVEAERRFTTSNSMSNMNIKLEDA